MPRMVLRFSFVLLLLSVRLGVNGLVNDDDGDDGVARSVQAAVPSERARDIEDSAKKINANSAGATIHDDDAKVNPTSSDKPPGDRASTTSTTKSTDTLLGEETAADDRPRQVEVARNETAEGTTIGTSKVTTIHDGDNDDDAENTTTANETSVSSPAVNPETEKSTIDAAASTTTSSESVSESTTTTSSTAPTIETTVNAETVTVTLPVESLTSEKTSEEPKVEATEANDPGMSSGIIALVMAIVFAVVVIIFYIGLLLWRRYLEFRYGNRELLVNDLEFDTNDLRHFEL